MDDFKERFEAAKKHRKEQIEDQAREVYKFCFNGREIEWDAVVKYNQDPEEIFTDDPAVIAEEFYGELFSTMTPENQPWVEYEAGNAVPQDQVKEAEKQLEGYEQAIDRSVRGSNYYDEGPAAFQDAVVGTVAMWGDRYALTAPITWEAVPISQVYTLPGPLGIEDRFRRQKFKYKNLERLFPEASFPEAIKKKIKSSKGSADVIRGFWPYQNDTGTLVWRQEVRVDNKPIGMDRDLEGLGSVPLQIGRYNPIANSSWGVGPGIKALPTMRVMNEMSLMILDGMDRNLNPAFIYHHDGILDFSDGIEAGIGYPASLAAAESFREIGNTGTLEYGYFSYDQLKETLRHAFYREMMQRGKTPPSATQVLSDDQKQLRRIARPGSKLWRELGVGVLKRTEYLERQEGGSLRGVPLPLLDEGVVTARPISPLERAQAREKVLVAQTIMQMTAETMGPEQAALEIDAAATMNNVKAELKDDIVTFRSQEEKMALMQSQAQLQQGGVPNEQEAPTEQP